MRSIVMLLLVFGATIAVFIMHWVRRAASVTADASEIFKQTGSLGETMRRLYAQEANPDAIRLSAAQVRYLDRNFDEFTQVCGISVRAWTEHFLEKYQADRKNKATEAELTEAQAQITAAVTVRLAKEWCDLRGVA